MASPRQHLREIDRRIEQLRQRADRGIASSAGNHDRARQNEIETLREYRRRFLRLNPREGALSIDRLPQEIRSALGEWSHWYVVDPEATRNLRIDEVTRAFTRRSGGRWREMHRLCALDKDDECLVVRRLRKPGKGGGGFAAPRRQATGGDGEGHEERTVRPAPEPPPEIRERTLVIRMLGREGSPARRLVVTDDRGKHLQRNPLEGETDTVRFGHMDPEARITLTATGNGVPRQTVFEDVPFRVLAEGGLTRKHLTDNGPDANVHVLSNDNQNGSPRIVAAPEPPRFGVFFDGTGNNLYNDRQDPRHPETLRDGKAPTNVAKLYELYPQDSVLERYYVEGIGTQRGREDNNKLDMGVAHTFGERVDRGLRRARQNFDRFDLALHKVLDVFGFSRGAAAARAFVNQVHHLQKTQPDYWGGARITFGFVGLFDTVGSVGMPGDADDHNVFAQGPLPAPIVLDLAPAAVQRVVHLTARDEMRKNFPLRSIRPGAEATPPDHFKETALPGVHSDVGGGYDHKPQTVYYPKTTIEWWDDAEREERIEALLQDYEQQYAAPGIALKPVIGRTASGPDGWRRTPVHCTWTRRVQPALSHYPLERMHAAALAAGVPLAPLKKLGRLGFAYEVDERLRKAIEAAEADGRGSEAYDDLYHGWIHHSHQYADERGNAFPNVFGPDDDAEYTTDNGVREIFFDEPDKGIAPDVT